MRHPLRISITSSLETCSWKTFVARPDQTNINDFICAGATPSINPSYLNLTTYLIESSQTQTQRGRERNAPKPNISKHSVPKSGRMFAGALEPLIGEGALTGGAPIPGPSPFKSNGLEINPDPFQPNGLEIKGSCDRSSK